MTSPLNAPGMGSFTSTLMAISEQGLSAEHLNIGSQGIEFSELLSAQGQLSEILDELTDLLPEAELARLETLLSGGNPLPLPAGAGLPAASLGVPMSGAALPMLDNRIPAGTPLQAAEESGVDPQLPAGLLRLFAATREPQAGTSQTVEEIVQAGHGVGNSPNPSGGSFSSMLAPISGALSETHVTPPTFNPMLASGSAAAGPLAEPGLVLRPTVPAGPAELNLPLGAEGWDKAMGERILWMVGHSVQGATLRITPPHLGPVDIQLSLQHEQASVSFGAQHALVREALEAGIPRLREMFLENNLQLVNVDVSQRDAAGQQRSASGGYPGRQEEGGERYPGNHHDDGELGQGAVRHFQSNGLLDDYA
ncbi:MAG: flagellar hook-length control protein FliK [Gammaproteobacteria bacterium]|nr:flagellar hook-length control protein FliK [Gammaproteobacteria bacterium]